jgi:hypothetical protein
MNIPRYYAGIGSRSTPAHVLKQMESLARGLSQKGYTLRSGGAKGADTAFEKGARTIDGPAPEIYYAEDAAPTKSDAAEWAHRIAREHHPAWHALRSPYVRNLMARNTFQVLGYGPQEPVSRFVLCWTPDGAEKATSRDSGGTGQAIRLAIANGIPVFNLANGDAIARLNLLLT